MTSSPPPIDADLVRNLLHGQFPEFAGETISPVDPQGWNNATYRLGASFSVRLPRSADYAPAILRESRWLPFLQANLPITIPTEIKLAQPCALFPFHWSVRIWVDGTPLDPFSDNQSTELAKDLAAFLNSLHAAPTADGPLASRENFWRGAPIAGLNKQCQAALERLPQTYDRQKLIAIWNEALAAPQNESTVWLHGDLSPGNLLIQNGRMCGVIDFGQFAIGDPACDLVMAWTFFRGEAREAFLSALTASKALVARSKGWALWKAALIESGLASSNSNERAMAPHTLDELQNEVSL